VVTSLVGVHGYRNGLEFELKCKGLFWGIVEEDAEEDEARCILIGGVDEVEASSSNNIALLPWYLNLESGDDE